MRIYTNDSSKLPRSLSRESSQRTATEVEQQPLAPNRTGLPARRKQASEEERGHSLGTRTRMICERLSYHTVAAAKPIHR